MHALLEALLASVVCLIAWILYCVAIVARRRIVIKRQFPGPPTTSFLLGNPPPPCVLLQTSRNHPCTQLLWRAGGTNKCLSSTLPAILSLKLCFARMQATSPRRTSLIATRCHSTYRCIML